MMDSGKRIADLERLVAQITRDIDRLVQREALPASPPLGYHIGKAVSEIAAAGSSVRPTSGSVKIWLPDDPTDPEGSDWSESNITVTALWFGTVNAVSEGAWCDLFLYPFTRPHRWVIVVPDCP